MLNESCLNMTYILSTRRPYCIDWVGQTGWKQYLGCAARPGDIQSTRLRRRGRSREWFTLRSLLVEVIDLVQAVEYYFVL